jgi:hypothetical protein
VNKALKVCLAICVLAALTGCSLAYNREVTYEFTGGTGTLVYYLGGEQAVLIDELGDLQDYWEKEDDTWSRTFRAKSGDLLMLRIHKDTNSDAMTARILVDDEVLMEETTSYSMSAYVWATCP